MRSTATVPLRFVCLSVANSRGEVKQQADCKHVELVDGKPGARSTRASDHLQPPGIAAIVPVVNGHSATRADGFGAGNDGADTRIPTAAIRRVVGPATVRTRQRRSKSHGASPHQIVWTIGIRADPARANFRDQSGGTESGGVHQRGVPTRSPADALGQRRDRPGLSQKRSRRHEEGRKQGCFAIECIDRRVQQGKLCL